MSQKGHNYYANSKMRCQNNTIKSMTYWVAGVEVTKKVTDKLLIYKTYFHFDTLTPHIFEIALLIIKKVKIGTIYKI